MYDTACKDTPLAATRPRPVLSANPSRKGLLKQVVGCKCQNTRQTPIPATTLGPCPPYMSMLIRYISNIRINLATNASRWKMTLVPVLIRCS